jgi:hypothetical protein
MARAAAAAARAMVFDMGGLLWGVRGWAFGCEFRGGLARVSVDRDAVLHDH